MTKTIVIRPSNPWYNEELHESKHQKRKLERKWKTTKLTIDHEINRNHCAHMNKLLKEARIRYYSEKIESCGRDAKTLFNVTKKLLGREEETILPSTDSSKELAQKFSDFFIDKINKIRDAIRSKQDTSYVNSANNISIMDVNELEEFIPVSTDELKTIILKSLSKSCELDPIPTWLLKECLNELLPTLIKIINASLETAYVPKCFKSSIIRPLIKKRDADINILKNYRPVSNLPYLSKILERSWMRN